MSLFLFNNNGSFISKASLGEYEETEDIQAELNHLLNLWGISWRAAVSYNHLQGELRRGRHEGSNMLCCVLLTSNRLQKRVGASRKAKEMFGNRNEKFLLAINLVFIQDDISADLIFPLILLYFQMFCSNLRITLIHFSCLNVLFEWN